MSEHPFDYGSYFMANGITDPEVINALKVLHERWLALSERYPDLTMREYLDRLAALSTPDPQRDGGA